MVVGRAMSRILRHSTTLVVNQSGFAWMEDLIIIMFVEDQIYATPAQILYVIARDRKSRFQAVQQAGTQGLDPKNFVVRAVHGHSPPMQDQMRDASAQQGVRDSIPIMNYAT